MQTKHAYRLFLAIMLLNTAGTIFSQTKMPAVYGEPRTAAASSFYTKRHQAYDSYKSLFRHYNEVLQPDGKTKRIQPVYEPHLQYAVKALNNPPKTVVFDGSIKPEEIFAYMDNPDKLYFNNGKAYVIVKDQVQYLTDVEFLGEIDLATRKALKTDLDNFSRECSSKYYVPDVITVELKNRAYIITAFRSASTGRVFLHQRINLGTSRIFKRFRFEQSDLAIHSNSPNNVWKPLR